MRGSIEINVRNCFRFRNVLDSTLDFLDRYMFLCLGFPLPESERLIKVLTIVLSIMIFYFLIIVEMELLFILYLLSLDLRHIPGLIMDFYIFLIHS